MSNSPIDGHVAAFEYDVRYLKKGKHSAMMFLPPAYHAPIGLVVAHWGNFESSFDKCLSALIQGEVADGIEREAAKLWEKLNYKRRRSLFKDICNEWVATWEPQAAESLIATVDRSADLHWRRNIIAHGGFQYTVAPFSSDVTEVKAVSPSTAQELRLTVDSLVKLYHDISHLTADLVLSFQRIGGIGGQFYAFPDTQILEAFRQTNRSHHPNSTKVTAPPESSQE